MSPVAAYAPFPAHQPIPAPTSTEVPQKYECATCGTNYSRLEYLKRHERKHQDIRPFKCPKCLKEFARSDVLLRHRRRQHPDDPTLPPQAPPPLPKILVPRPDGTVPQRRRRRSSAAVLNPSPPSPDVDMPYSPAPALPDDPIVDANHFPVVPPFQFQNPPSPDQETFVPVGPYGRFPSHFPHFHAPNAIEPSWTTRGHNDDSPVTAASASDTVFPSPLNPQLDQTPDGVSPSSSGSSQQSGDTALTNISDYIPAPQDYPHPLDHDPFLGEQTLLKIEGQQIEAARGVCHRDPADRFYVPPGFFAYCYQVARWRLPRLSVLCALASRSLNGMLVHMPLVHEPTFRLASLPGPLAFAICSVGGVASMRPNRPTLHELGSWGQEIQPQVRLEKADMLVRNFQKQQKSMTRLEMLAVVQALLLYNAPSLMSGDDYDRLVGHLFLGTIIGIARQAGLFVPTAEHALNPPSFPCSTTSPDPEKRWNDWIQLETYRRAAFLVYVLDTLSSLDSGIPTLVHPANVAHLPLPAPDLLWAAPTAQEWEVQMSMRPMPTPTLDDVLHDLLRPAESPGSGDDDRTERRLAELGPFARIVSVLTLVRGLVALGEGERAGGPVTKRWAQTSGTRALDAYQAALHKWKKRWDSDRLCYRPHITQNQQLGYFDAEPSSSTSVPTRSSPENSTDPSNLSSSTAQALVNHAAPYYWFAHMLVSTLRSRMRDDTSDEEDGGGEQDADGRAQKGPNHFAGVDFRRMLFVAREYASGHSP